MLIHDYFVYSEHFLSYLFFDDSNLFIERIRRIYEKFPRIPVTHNLDMSDDDMQRVHEALGAAKTRVECCSSFLKAAIRLVSFSIR